MGKKRKPQACRYTIIPQEDDAYRILEEMRKFHVELDVARIALAWRDEYKQDKDGHVVLGKCVKVGALQKEFADFDFLIVLNRTAWNWPDFTEEKKRALVDHELCHAAAAEDKDGNALRDARGRTVWRCRKHDIEEFQAIIERHGCYKRDLEAFAKTMMDRQRPLLAAQEKGRQAAARMQ